MSRGQVAVSVSKIANKGNSLPEIKQVLWELFWSVPYSRGAVWMPFDCKRQLGIHTKDMCVSHKDRYVWPAHRLLWLYEFLSSSTMILFGWLAIHWSTYPRPAVTGCRVGHWHDSAINPHSNCTRNSVALTNTLH